LKRVASAREGTARELLGARTLTVGRRKLFHLIAAAAALPIAPRFACAETYPTRPVRIMVGFAAGSANDILARLMAQWLSERLGQQFIVETRPGASGNLANAYETGHPYVSTLDPTLVASPGGFPLVEGGKLIGAIGCSGGTGDQDALICKVGADMIK